MRYVVAAWIGETIGGYGRAVCGVCGWTTTSSLYGKVALAALAHDRQERLSVEGVKADE